MQYAFVDVDRERSKIAPERILRRRLIVSISVAQAVIRIGVSRVQVCKAGNISMTEDHRIGGEDAMSELRRYR
jgi:hypothetical protein